MKPKALKKFFRFKHSIKAVSSIIVAIILIIIIAVGAIIGVASLSGLFAYQETRPTLHHFSFIYLEAQTTGEPFEVTIRAMDQNDHVYTEYTGTNTFTSPRAITPTSTTNFTDGIWTGQITFSDNSSSEALISTSGGGKNGISNIFYVSNVPLVLDHFTFDAIEYPATPSEPFNITIRARDQFGNSFTSYTGTNNLIVSSGTITPTKTTPFEGGVWIGEVTLHNPTVSPVWINTTGNMRTGESNLIPINGIDNNL
ncbi:MAG: hypothetical protein NWF01_07295 [Candidatus Bathyarchaeota archaeon]|nr:hypothetical protein [Candidatus Bathyarchaeota archaeon]